MLAQLPLLRSSGNEVSSREKGLSGFLWETISGSIGEKSRQSVFRNPSPTHASRLHLGKVTSFCKEKIFGDTRGVQVLLLRGVKPCVRSWWLNKAYYNTIELVSLNSLSVNLIFLILQMSGEMGRSCEIDGTGIILPCRDFSLWSWVDCRKAHFLVQAALGSAAIAVHGVQPLLVFTPEESWSGGCQGCLLLWSPLVCVCSLGGLRVNDCVVYRTKPVGCWDKPGILLPWSAAG